MILVSFSKDGLISASVSQLTKQALAIAVITAQIAARRWRVGRLRARRGGDVMRRLSAPGSMRRVARWRWRMCSNRVVMT
jgi:hypothetical protein